MNRSLRPLAILAAALRQIPQSHRWLGACEGEAKTASYCYGVWLRHLALANRYVLQSTAPQVVAELGPGPSLGALVAALLTSAQRGIALDVVRHATSGSLNRQLAIELADLLQERTRLARKDGKGGIIRPILEDDSFPADVPGLLEAADRARERLREILTMLAQETPELRYVAPWTEAREVEEGTVDFIFSQAVMEHVDDLPRVYAACGQWLKSGGLMSHQIDFRCHGTARHWNGHYTLSDGVWGFLAKARPYLLNRAPPSLHIQLIRQAGFEIVAALPQHEDSQIRADDLAPRFRDMSTEDLRTSGMYILAKRV